MQDTLLMKKACILENVEKCRGLRYSCFSNALLRAEVAHRRIAWHYCCKLHFFPITMDVVDGVGDDVGLLLPCKNAVWKIMLSSFSHP